MIRQSSSPQSRGEETSFWNFYTDANITLYASNTYNDKEKKEKEDDDEVENEFFVPHGYLRDDEEEMDEDEAFNKKKMLLLDIKEGLKDPWLNLSETDLETQIAPSAAHEVENAEEVEILENQ